MWIETGDPSYFCVCVINFDVYFEPPPQSLGRDKPDNEKKPGVWE